MHWHHPITDSCRKHTHKITPCRNHYSRQGHLHPLDKYEAVLSAEDNVEMWSREIVVSSSERYNFQFTRVNVRGQRQWPSIQRLCTIAYGALDVIIIIIIIIININITTKSNSLGQGTRQLDSSTSTRRSYNAKVFRYMRYRPSCRVLGSRGTTAFCCPFWPFEVTVLLGPLYGILRENSLPIWGYRLRPRTRHGLNDSQLKSDFH